jgi:hypothetical protein
MAYQKKTGPVSPAVESASSDIPVVKRKQVVQEGPQQKIYVIDSGGGVVFRISQNDVFVFDKETGQNRAIRYCPGERSVFADEQSPNAVRSDVVFREGTLLVDANKPNLAKFLDMHPGNKANGGGIFKLLELGKKVEVELDSEFLVHDAITLVREKGIDELIPVAMSLGINTDQGVKEIKHELLREAKARPRVFIDMFDNPVVKTRSMIIQAMDFQIISARGDGMYWYDSGRIIVSTPAGMDSVEVMTQFCMTDKGLPVTEELKKELSKIA